jgi:16S rRNA (cytosine967-C5)-methyltransferase
MSTGYQSRLCAYYALNAVFDGKKPLDESLDKYAQKYDLSAQDKSFAHALCGFVLRYKDALQNQIDVHVKKSAPSQVNLILLVGAAQIYLMNSVPAHAAVDTCVELCSVIKCDKHKGLVNAVLRNLIRGEAPDLKPSLPQWLVDTWVKDYNADLAREIEQASLQEAKTGITNKNGSWFLLDSLRRQGSVDERDPRLRGGGNLSLSPDEWVQDYSSAQPVALLHDLKGKHVLDLCAAPGGKTMQLAAKGAHITAIDISEKRLRRLKENLDRTNLSHNVDIICADILKWKPERHYDVVLLDAPCSATGTIRRHPDLPHIRTQKDIDALVKLQSQLLNHVKDWGDMLVYCTCSLQKDEGERQIEKFLSDNPSFRRVKDSVRLLPSDGDRDGFFISTLQAKA